MQKEITPIQQGSAKVTSEFYKNLVRYLQSVGRISCNSTEEVLRSKELELEKMDPSNKKNWMREYELGLTRECLFCNTENLEGTEHHCYCWECCSSIGMDKETCWENKGYCDDCLKFINEDLPEMIEYNEELGVKCRCVDSGCAKCLDFNCGDKDCIFHLQKDKDERRRKRKALEERYYVPVAQEFRRLLETRLYNQPKPGERATEREKFLETIVTSHIERAKIAANAKIVELEKELKLVCAEIPAQEEMMASFEISKLESVLKTVREELVKKPGDKTRMSMEELRKLVESVGVVVGVAAEDPQIERGLEIEAQIEWIRAMIARSECDTEVNNNSDTEKRKNQK